MRRTKFVNGECYHIYNRGVDKRKVFLGSNDYLRFLLSIDLLNDKKDGLMILWRDFKKSNPNAQLADFLKPGLRKEKLVDIIAYCFNPNHYHFILRQVSDRGVEKFMHKLGTSYTKYFNQKNDRTGVLFQGRFKSIHIDSNRLLLHLSAYVNCNSEIHKIAKADDYRWCGFPEYLNRKRDGLCDKKIILGQFRRIEDYKKFAEESAKDMKERKEAKKLLFE